VHAKGGTQGPYSGRDFKGGEVLNEVYKKGFLSRTYKDMNTNWERDYQERLVQPGTQKKAG